VFTSALPTACTGLVEPLPASSHTTTALRVISPNLTACGLGCARPSGIRSSGRISERYHTHPSNKLIDKLKDVPAPLLAQEHGYQQHRHKRDDQKDKRDGQQSHNRDSLPALDGDGQHSNTPDARQLQMAPARWIPAPVLRAAPWLPVGVPSCPFFQRGTS
jgi:hypothetical protein